MRRGSKKNPWSWQVYEENYRKRHSDEYMWSTAQCLELTQELDKKYDKLKEEYDKLKADHEKYVSTNWT